MNNERMQSFLIGTLSYVDYNKVEYMIINGCDHMITTTKLLQVKNQEGKCICPKCGKPFKIIDGSIITKLDDEIKSIQNDTKYIKTYDEIK